MTISLLIATYNNPVALKHCLDTVFLQEILPDEILISEDKPGCDYDGIIDKSYWDNSIIRFYRQDKNLGRTKNYRFLLDNAKSDYVMFLDGDDELINPSLFKDAKSVFQQTDCTMFSGGCRKMYGQVYYDQILASDNITMYGEEYFKQWIGANQTLPHSSTIFNRNQCLKVDGYTIDILNTDILSLREVLLESKIFISKTVYSQWNYHGTNASCQKDVKEMVNNLKTVTIPYKMTRHLYGRNLGFMWWYIRASTKYIISMLHLLYPNLKQMFKFLMLLLEGYE